LLLKPKKLSEKIKVGAVSYLNAKPLTFGLTKEIMKDRIDLSFDYPANLAAQLKNDELDIALIPVAALKQLSEYYIISDFCIASEDEVASVCLFSDVPVKKIKSILLDYQSRTSVALLKILLKEHWKIDPELITASRGYETDIKNDVAGLVIGDRALMQRNSNEYIYDLSKAWKEMTGLPFVFAVWVANKKLPPDFIHDFNVATGEGLNVIDDIIKEIQFCGYSMKTYYKQNIQYNLDKDKKQALQLFLSKID
jgi:chorismate dehydratase